MGEVTERRREGRAKLLDVAGWAVFCAWIAAVLLLKELPDGTGALGVGGIILAGSLVRMLFHMSVSNYWLVIGVVFALAGTGEMMHVDLPLIPVALIICGVLLLLHRRSGKRRRDKHVT